VLDSETFLCSVNPEGPSDDTVLVGRITDMSGKIIATWSIMPVIRCRWAAATR
jgi:hypothetical protein